MRRRLQQSRIHIHQECPQHTIIPGSGIICVLVYSDLSTVVEPIQRLTHKNVEFKWHSEKQASFELKELITSTVALANFNVNSKRRLVVDASPVGLVVVLIQLQGVEWRVTAYASRGLTDVGRRYSRVEREALALVWACEHLNMYIFGRNFELEYIIVFTEIKAFHSCGTVGSPLSSL